MNTHEAARVLSQLANSLKAAPDQSISELGQGKVRKIDPDSVDVPRALGMLVALSHFDKTQWLQVIEDLKLPVDVRLRDASRDIMWKILRHLEEHPDDRKRLTSGAQRQRTQTSPELAQALELLLKSS